MLRHIYLLAGSTAASFLPSVPGRIGRILKPEWREWLNNLLAIPQPYAGLLIFATGLIVAGYLTWNDEHEKRLAAETQTGSKPDFQAQIDSIEPIFEDDGSSWLYVFLHLVNRGASGAVGDWAASYIIKDTDHRATKGAFKKGQSRLIYRIFGQNRNLYPDDSNIEAFGQRRGWLAFKIDDDVALHIANEQLDELTISFADMSGRPYVVTERNLVPS